MKTIILRNGPIKSLELFKQVLSSSPSSPLTVNDIRRRCKVLDKLDVATGDTLVLEDSEAQTLSSALNATPWAVANRDILQVIDDVEGAKDAK